MQQGKINLEDCYFGFFSNTTDITGVLMFLTIRFGGMRTWASETKPFYKRKDKKLWER